MSAQHTPGPWRHHEGCIKADHDDLPLSYDKCLRDYQCRQLIAETVDGANARLIAAAPELLDAAKMIVDLAINGPGVEIPLDALKRVQAAIAKATAPN